MLQGDDGAGKGGKGGREGGRVRGREDEGEKEGGVRRREGGVRRRERVREKGINISLCHTPYSYSLPLGCTGQV